METTKQGLLARMTVRTRVLEASPSSSGLPSKLGLVRAPLPKAEDGLKGC